jgi:hypothetical protein
VLGPWCAHAPLWCNPFLCQLPGSQSLPLHGLEQGFEDLAELNTINTVQDAMMATQDLARVTSAEQYQQTVWPFWLHRSPLFLDRQHASERLEALVHAIPAAWRHAVDTASPQGLLDAPPPADVLSSLMQRLGWERAAGSPVMCSNVTVKSLTQLQMQPILSRRRDKHAAFLALASEGLPSNQHATHQELLSLLKRLWRLKWDNYRKELFWRITLDGVANSARMHMLGQLCACGVPGPGRDHHYWDCPVAQAVIAVIRLQLPAAVTLSRVHVWMSRVPHATLHSGVWMVTCQAAFLAMDKGRGLLCEWALRPPHVRTLPLDIQLCIASRVAVATFWDMLADFVGLKLYPAEWVQHISATHPFIAVSSLVEVEPKLVVNRPSSPH